MGAKGDGVNNDTRAIRAALNAAHKKGNGATVFFPQGLYRVAPTEKGQYTFVISKSNITIEGEGPDKSILSFSAWNMQSPEQLMLDRGGAFRIQPPARGVTDITFRGIRVTGNAAPTAKAGNWYGDGQKDGWDMTHKGLAIWGKVGGVLIENTEWDHWRGEVLYAGGGKELGTFAIRHSKIHDSNASAISMTGNVIIEDCEIYNTYNGVENLSFPGQHNVVRDSLIEPNRNLPFPVGKNGIVYAGFFDDSSLLVENCTIKNAVENGVFLSESAHHVTIRNNLFEDNGTSAIYGIFLGMAPYKEMWGERGYSDLLIENNKFHAVKRNGESAVSFFLAEGGNDWVIRGNEVLAAKGFVFKEFARFPGPTGTFLIENNVLNDVAVPFYPHGTEGPRPIWKNNTLTGATALGQTAFDYNPDLKMPIDIAPLWTRFQIIDLKDGTDGKIVRIPANKLLYYSPGFTFELRRATELRSGEEGLEVKPDVSWNTLNRGYMLYTDSVLTLRMGRAGKFEFVSYQPRSGNPMTLTGIPETLFDPQMIRFQGFNEVTLAPKEGFVFKSFSGVPENVPVTIHYNDKVIIKHVPGVISISTGRNFVASKSGDLKALKVNGILKISAN